MHTLPTPAPLAPFSSFLAFSFALFFLSGLLGGLPGSFSQRTPFPPPTPTREEKRERTGLRLFWCVCVCVCQHLYPRMLRNLIHLERTVQHMQGGSGPFSSHCLTKTLLIGCDIRRGRSLNVPATFT